MEIPFFEKALFHFGAAIKSDLHCGFKLLDLDEVRLKEIEDSERVHARAVFLREIDVDELHQDDPEGEGLGFETREQGVLMIDVKDALKEDLEVS